MTADSTTLGVAVARPDFPEQELPRASALTERRVAGHPLRMDERAASVGEIYRRHAPSVFRRALRILGSEAEARAVLQELFVALFDRAQPQVVGPSLNGYLYGATTLACLMRLRARRSRATVLARDADLGVATASPTRAAMGVLRGTLAQLPEPLAVVAVYSVLDGLDSAEMAELLGCSQRQVGRLLGRLELWGRGAEPACAAE